MARSYQEVELYLRGHDFPDLDKFSKSDPFVVLSMKTGYNGQWREIGRTETILENQHPIFEKRFKVKYIFEQEQNIRIDAYDEDEKNCKNLNKHDYVGTAEFLLGEVVHYPGGTMRKVIKKTRGPQKGMRPRNKKSKMYTTMEIRVEEIKQCNHIIHLTLGASKLPKMDWIGGADPFLEFFRVGKEDTSDKSMVKVFTTEIKNNTRNPVWKPINLGVGVLCNGDFDRPLVIKCQDFDKDGKCDLIGQVETNLNDLMKMSGESFTLKRPTKAYKEYGNLNIKNSFLQERYTFVEYLRGGLDMRLLLAIDFTGSNGHWLDRGTLHYIREETGTSQYMDAISDVGRIVEVYSDDKIFASWGFGAVVGQVQRVNHCFPLTLTDNAHVRGTEGVLGTYRNALNSKQLQFSGPTLFEHIIKAGASVAKSQTAEKMVYNVLMILTDGVINDMQKTIDAIIDASNLPLSIIIVGLGKANFKNMEKLDADDTPLVSSKGKRMNRDIVQFVPYRDFVRAGPGALAESVLAELPNQVVEYYSKMKVWPNKPTEAKAYEEDAFRSQETIVIDNDSPNIDDAKPAYADQELPPGVEKMLDAKSGKYFYINHITKETSWTVPEMKEPEATV